MCAVPPAVHNKTNIWFLFAFYSRLLAAQQAFRQKIFFVGIAQGLTRMALT
jgi:hypothetical protein